MSDLYNNVILGDKTLKDIEYSKTLDYVVDTLCKEKEKLLFYNLVNYGLNTNKC
jgi:hypothetical protein